MSHLAGRGLGAIFDFGVELWFDPDAAMRDLFCIRLRLADQRFELLAQFFGPGLVKPVIDFPGIDEVFAMAAGKIETVPPAAVQREARNRQGLALRAGLLHPIIAATGIVSAVGNFGDDALQAYFAGVLEYLGARSRETFAELKVGACYQLFEKRLPLGQGQLTADRSH